MGLRSTNDEPLVMLTRTGGRILIDALRAQDVERAFCVPGESYLAALDALYDTPSIELIVGRQEGGVAYMAEAYGKLTGRPGVAFVTRGPGASNACVGVHTAHQDATPMLLFVGCIPRAFSGRLAFQEVDIPALFTPLAKWATTISSAARIPEIVARAFSVAINGRPGPVVIGLPEDVLTEAAAVADAPAAERIAAAPRAEDLARLRTLLAAAKRPLLLLGGSDWTADACGDIAAFAQANALPVATAFRRQDRIDPRDAHYCGDIGIGVDPALARRLGEADLIIAVGALLGEATTSGYRLLDVPTPRAALVHVHPGSDELGRVYHPTLGICAGMPEFARAARALEPIASPPWRAWLESARAEYVQNLATPQVPGAVNPAAIVKSLRARLKDDAVITVGAGNFTGWVQRFYEFRTFGTQLGPTNGSMGYGLPAALAAKALRREAQVIAWCGDGDFLMTGQELATAVAHELNVVAIVINNGIYGTIRMHQEREYPGRVIGTDLHNPDFVAYAQAFGAFAERVTRTEEFEPALERALAAGRPALIEVVVDPEAITTRTTLSAIRAESARSH